MTSAPGPSPFTDHKESVRVATTTDISLVDLPLVIDGVQMSYGDRMLVKDQNDPIQNGIYIWLGEDETAEVTTGGRDGQLTSGALVIVEQGTENADTMWMLATDGPIEVGETPLEFVEFGAPDGVGATVLDELTDVDTSGANPGDTLSFTGSDWVASTPSVGLDAGADESITGNWTFSGGATLGGSNFYTFEDNGSWVFLKGRLTFQSHVQFGDLAFDNSTNFRQVYRGSGGNTFTLQISGSGQRSHLIENQGTGPLTVATDPSDQISLWGTNYPSVVLAPGEALELHSSSSGSFWFAYKKQGASGGGGIDLAAEVAEGCMNTGVSAATNGSNILGAGRDWVTTMDGGDFASFDDANNRPVALQAGRYRFSWNFDLDANRASAGAGGVGVNLAGSVFGFIGRPTDFKYHAAANSDLSTVISGSRVIDMQANEYITATLYLANLASADLNGAHQFGYDGCRVTLEYLGPTPA